MGIAVPFLGGCGSTDSQRPAPMEVTTSMPGSNVAAVSAKCETGAVQHCKVTRGEFQGVASCFEGVQMCFEEAWGPCGEPAEVLPPGTAMPAPAGS